MGTVFYYVDVNKKADLTALLERLGMAGAELSPADLKKTLGTILGEHGYGKALPGMVNGGNVPPFYRMPEVLLFCDVADPALDIFLAEYRKAGLQPIANKAIVTPTNIAWTLYDLLQELHREQESLK